MAYAMTKRGSQDNIITYEFICDTATDMNAIENRYRTLGTIAIVLQGENGGLEVYIAGSNKQWNPLTNIGSSGDSTSGSNLSIYICAQNEVSNGLPNIQDPDETTIYLVSAGNESGNLYEEYIYVNDAWEKFGAANIDLSGYAPIANPEFTGSISLNRKSGTTAGTESIAVGNETAANGAQTVAFGRSTISNGDVSFTCGTGLVAAGGSEFVIGTYNKLPAQPWQPNTAYVMDDYVVYQDKLYYCASPHTSAATFEEDNGWYHARKYLLTIGNGNNSSGRGNAFVVDIWGNAHLLGDLYVGCSDDSQGGTKVATISQIPDTSLLAPKASPEFTGSISLGRVSNSTVGNNSTAEGIGVIASGQYSHAEGMGVQATGSCSHAEGTGTTASGPQSHAEGSGAQATGDYSHAEGAGTTASGMNSHAEGGGTQASGLLAHAEGGSTIASGDLSHAEGRNTIASGFYSHVGGCFNIQDSYDSWTEWTANTPYAVGDKVKQTITSDNETTVSGYICNTAHTSDSTFSASYWDAQQGKMNYTEIIGNGTGTSARSNARVLDWNGNERLMGDIYVGCNADSTGGTKLPRIPEAPSIDGTYILQATVTNGTPTYSWISLSSLSGVTF